MAAVTPQKLADSGTEQGLQRALFLAVTQEIRPHFRLIDCMYHVPNGGYRGEAKDAAIAGNNLKLMGAKSGVPDVHLPLPYQGYASLYIELKLPKQHLRDAQRAFIPLLVQGRNFVAIVDDWLTAFTLVQDYISASPITWQTRYGTTGIFDPDDRMNHTPKKRARKKPL